MKRTITLRTLLFAFFALALITAPAYGQFRASPNPIVFPDPGNPTNPFATRYFTLFSDNPSTVAFTYTSQTLNGGTNWLTVQPIGSTTPAPIGVSVNTSGLATGFYQGTITFTGGSFAPYQVQVNLTVGSGGGGGAFTLSPSSVSFNSVQNGAAQTQNVTLSSSSAVSYTAFVTSQGTASTQWLSVSPQSGNNVTFASLGVTANPVGLAIGTYQGTISVNAGGSTQTIFVTLNVSQSGGGGTFTLNPSSVSFNSVQNGSAQTQNVTLSSSSAVSYTAFVTSQGTASTQWLSVSPQSASNVTFASLGVTANPVGLAIGTYQGQIQVNAGGSTQTIFVTLTVSQSGGGGTFNLNPSSVSFNSVQNGSAQTQNVTLTAPSPVSYTAFATSQGSSTTQWLSVSPQSANNVTFASIGIIANPVGLAIGTYQGQVQINAGGSTQTIFVSLNVSQTGGGGGGTFNLSPTSVSFNSVQNGSAQTQNVTLTATSAVSYTAFAASQGGAATSWLSVSPQTGNNVTFANLAVNANPAGLAIGTYQGQIQVTAGGSSQTIFAVLTVSQTGGGGGGGTGNGSIAAVPSQFTFNYQTGQAAPATQTAQLVSTVGSALNYTASPTTTSGGSWLLATPTFGQTGTQLSVNVQPTSLSAGTYSGQVQIFANGILATSIPVTLIVTGTGGGGGGGGIVSPSTLSFSFPSSASSPQSQTLSLNTNTQTTFSIFTVSQNNWLTVQPTSGSTNPFASVVVTANPSGLPNNTYPGTITIVPANGAAVTVSVTMVIGTGGGGTTSISAVPANLSFSYQPGTAVLPNSQTIEITTPAPISFTATGNGVFNSTTWLGVGPTTGQTQLVGGVAKATLAVGVFPSNLPVGTYNGTITISASGLNPLTIPVTLNVGTTSSGPGSLTPTQLSFSFQSGGTNPPTQLVTVNTPNGQAGSFAANAITTSGGAWLNVSPVGGSAPGALAVTANGQGLAPGTYSGTVNVTLSGSSPSSIPVTFNVSQTPVLRLSVTNALFNYQIGGGVPPGQGQNVEVTTTGGPVAFSVSTQMLSGGATNWLNTNVTNGTALTNVAININAQNLPAGTYTGTVAFSAAGQAPLVVPVTLNVSTLPLLNSSVQTLNFSAAVGQVPQPQTLGITTTGGTLSFQATASVVTGGSWLSVATNSATTPGSVTVSVNPLSLADGIYYGAVVISASQSGTAGNSPLVVPVVYVVGTGTGGGGGGGGTPSLVVSGPLSFTQIQGGGQPPSQILNINSSTASLNYSLAVSTNQGGNWLQVSQSVGTTPSQVQVSVNGAALSNGTYTGSIIVTAQGASNTPQVIPVTMTVTNAPVITAAPTSLTFSASTVGSAPAAQSIALTSSGTNLNYSVTTSVGAGQPNWLDVTPTSGTTPGTLSVRPILTSLQPGTYQGTITINLGLPAPITIPVTLTYGTQAAPQITAVTNAGSLLPTAVSPGMIVAIFGSNLGPTTLARLRLTAAGLVDTTLETTRVLFDGIPSPMIYTRNDVVSAVVPYALTGRTSTRVVVEYQGVRSSELSYSVVSAAPGIFTTNQQGTGQGAVLNQDFSLNGVTNPTARGQFATVYLTGEGQTSPAGVDGLISSASLLRNPIGRVDVRVGGRPAQVIYAGSVPTTVLGLCQVSFFVPADAPVGGSVPLEVTIAGTASQAGVTMAVR